MGIPLRYSIVSACMVVFTAATVFKTYCAIDDAYRAQTDAQIETVRKGDLSILVLYGAAKQPLANTPVSLKQIQNDFGFGASVCWDSGFVKMGKDEYGSMVKKYFEWVTPENELKWYYNDTTGNQPCAPASYDDGDSIVDWALANGINVRGHNLFWNERVEFQAYCARPYGPYDGVDSSTEIKALSEEDRDAFIGEMSTRLDSMVIRYKGKVRHWDAVNEIVHFTTDNDGAREVRVPGLLATWTGKTGNGGAEVFNWILDRARGIDPDVKLCVNEYNVIEQAHDEADYISMINKINSGAGPGGKIDIIGLEGHFGGMISRTQNGSYAGYESVINTIAAGVDIDNSDMEFWFTEVDWNDQAPGNTADNMEELMRFAFSREDFGGLLLWIWWGGRLWRDDLANFLVDANFTETETGARWNALRRQWTTPDTTITTDANGMLNIRGFYGTYTLNDDTAKLVFTPEKLTDTIWLQPTAVALPGYTKRKAKMIFNGSTIRLEGIAGTSGPLYLSTYTIAGKLLSRIPITVTGTTGFCTCLPSGCSVYRIGTDKNVLYSGRIVNIQ
ncbi:MAG: endo-1,4-beta-xylanase [Chitinispirillaceae bacterium]|nr:endo-1,4-beta-xylanase [Chitinispirillaceae bacterium]